jgi:NADPH:quinone reductase-like Zn-dependent oxidoreductase
MLAAIPGPPDAEAGRARKVDARFVVHEADGSRLALAASYCAAKDLKPVIDRVMRLDAAREAVALVASGHARGKIILKP